MSRANYKTADYWARRAKSAGYGARSVFKLEEIDHTAHLFRKGARVLDLGASPGSWMQYACERVGRKGVVVGVDIKPLERELNENERFLEADVNELDPETLRAAAPVYDLVLSDMMPNTIGHKATDHYRSVALAERALYFASELGRTGSRFLVKVFQGADFDEYRAKLREQYHQVKIKKPVSSRKQSREIFLLCIGKKAKP